MGKPKEEREMRALIPMYVKMRTKLQEEKGATMVEYGLMVFLIAAVAIAAVTTLGTNISSVFTSVAGAI